MGYGNLLTNGEHDSLWRNVMGAQIPSGVENMRIMTNQMGYYNQYIALTKLYEFELISEKDYADNMIDYARAVCGLDDIEYDRIRSKFNKKYGEES